VGGREGVMVSVGTGVTESDSAVKVGLGSVEGVGATRQAARLNGRRKLMITSRSDFMSLNPRCIAPD